MPASTRIIFKGLEPPPLLRDLIDRRVAGLDRPGMGLVRCAVTVELVSPHRRKAPTVRAHVLLELPDQHLALARESSGGTVTRDMRLAVARCFDCAEYELGHLLAQRASAGARLHRIHLCGRVLALGPGGGVVHGEDGQDYSFAGTDGALAVGMAVTFHPKEGPDGASAWRVRPIAARQDRRPP